HQVLGRLVVDPAPAGQRAAARRADDRRLDAVAAAADGRGLHPAVRLPAAGPHEGGAARRPAARPPAAAGRGLRPGASGPAGGDLLYTPRPAPDRAAELDR